MSTLPAFTILFILRCFSHCTIIVSFITDVCLLVEHGACTQNALDDIYMFSWHRLGLQQTSCGYRSYSCLKTSLTKWEIFSSNWFVCKNVTQVKNTFFVFVFLNPNRDLQITCFVPKDQKPNSINYHIRQSPQNWPVGLVSCYFCLKEESLIGSPK